ncbi:hypothetical protein QBC44DRAFT_366791 [Cladorrhinum sp. PSN332]|nr:hypothetical protein QBC44DRAFT_366791 [Cladorrhinum sp. PSN332]
MKPASPDQGRRPSIGWVGGDEWEVYRPTIQELYQAQNLPLKDVMKIMEDRHGFRATQRMYKTRIKSWGLDKNFKETEVVELFRLRRERERVGKVKSTYMIRGREVDWDRVQSYIRRKGINISQLLNTTPIGPSAREVSCVTPPPPSTIPSASGGSSIPLNLPPSQGTATFPYPQTGRNPPPPLYPTHHDLGNNLFRISSPSSSSSAGAPSPSQGGFTTPSSSSAGNLLLTPISPIPGIPSPRRLSHPLPIPALLSETPSNMNSPFGPTITTTLASTAASTPTAAAGSTSNQNPTLFEFQSLLTTLYQTTMFQDGDKTWGTTEYWLRNTQSLEWFSVIRYKLALLLSLSSSQHQPQHHQQHHNHHHQQQQQQQQQKSSSKLGTTTKEWQKFCAYNRAFASVEGLSGSNVIGARTWYIVNYLRLTSSSSSSSSSSSPAGPSFWEEEGAGSEGKKLAGSILKEVVRVCGYKLVPRSAASAEKKPVPVGGDEDVVMEGGSGEDEEEDDDEEEKKKRGMSFVDEKVGFGESADRFLRAVLEKMLTGRVGVRKGMVEGVLMLEEDVDGYPVVKKEEQDDGWKSGEKVRTSTRCEESSGSRRWSTTCLISPTTVTQAAVEDTTTTDGRGLVGVLELGVRLLAQREEARAEEKLRLVVEGGFRFQGSGSRNASEEEKVLVRCASYHLSRIYRRRGRMDLAGECLMKAVEGSLFFDKFVSWDEAEFLFA